MISAWLKRIIGFGGLNRNQAFELGQRTAEAVAEDIDRMADDFLLERRRNFLAVLDGRIDGIVPIEGVAFQDQAQIELKVMLEEWSQRMTGQKKEIFDRIANRWPLDQFGSNDLLLELISSRVDWHYTQLFSEGLEHAADAVTVHKSAGVEGA